MNTECLSIYLSLISFIKVLQFSVYKIFTSFVKFNKYFIFDAIIVGFLYFSDSLLFF